MGHIIPIISDHHIIHDPNQNIFERQVSVNKYMRTTGVNQDHSRQIRNMATPWCFYQGMDIVFVTSQALNTQFISLCSPFNLSFSPASSIALSWYHDERANTNLGIRTGYSQLHSQSDIWKLSARLCHSLAYNTEKVSQLTKSKSQSHNFLQHLLPPHHSSLSAPWWHQPSCPFSSQVSSLLSYLLSYASPRPLHGQYLHLWSGLWSKGPSWWGIPGDLL